jgi:hypothetical protein
MGGICSMHGEDIKLLRNLVRNPEDVHSTVISKLILKRQVVSWIYLAQMWRCTVCERDNVKFLFHKRRRMP